MPNFWGGIQTSSRGFWGSFWKADFQSLKWIVGVKKLLKHVRLMFGFQRRFWKSSAMPAFEKKIWTLKAIIHARRSLSSGSCPANPYHSRTLEVWNFEAIESQCWDGSVTLTWTHHSIYFLDKKCVLEISNNSNSVSPFFPNTTDPLSVVVFCNSP